MEEADASRRHERDSLGSLKTEQRGLLEKATLGLQAARLLNEGGAG